jgi:hypothetical protein
MSKKVSQNHISILCLVFACTLLPTLSGCGGGKFRVTPAKGKVVCAGNPVTVGTVTFTPVGEGMELGKPATAAVGPDGTFVLTTNDRFDGAVVGKHRVVYVGSEGEEEEEESASKPAEGSAEEMAAYAKKVREQATKKMSCVLPGELIVEVTDGGENDFTIELVPAPTQSSSRSED